ncbi:ATP-binding protein [Streptococcus uberis 6780]|nr:ATP-binding protein [Streptococcus uberis 6780]
MKEKTIIFITHHDLVAKQSNQIIVLERGNIIEQGTYLELTQRKDSFFNHFFAE